MLSRTLFLTAALAAASPATADATCAFVRMGPRVLTTRSTALPADGGVLVGYGGNSTVGTGSRDDPSDTTAEWVATDAKHAAVAIARTQLAPGLSVVKLAGNAPTTIATTDHKPVGAFTHDAKAAANALPAPAVSAAKTTTSPAFRSTTTTSIVTLAKPPPPEAVALIVYEAGAPITYATLPDTHDTTTQLAVYEGGGHCAVPHPGRALQTASYTFAYVDAFGRLSPQSRPIQGR